jgi:hypothetical protein
MSIKDQLLRSVTQLETDSGLVHNWAHGDANTQVRPNAARSARLRN